MEPEGYYAAPWTGKPQTSGFKTSIYLLGSIKEQGEGSKYPLARLQERPLRTEMKGENLQLLRNGWLRSQKKGGAKEPKYLRYVARSLGSH